MDKKQIYEELCAMYGAYLRNTVRDAKRFLKKYPECEKDLISWKCSDYIDNLHFYMKLWHYLNDDPDGYL